MDELEILKRRLAREKKARRQAEDIAEKKTHEMYLANQELVKRSGEIAKARDEALEASKAKSSFLASMSHELRTPLNAIIGYSEMIEEEAKDLGQDGLIPDIRKIRAAGKHLLTLINGVLNIAKIEAGKFDIHCETFDVKEVINEVAAAIRPLAEEKGNNITVNCPDNAGVMHSDLTKVREVFFNLLGNACKFTAGGAITFTVVRQSVAGGDRLTFTVADTGIGMTQEQMDAIFKEFSQADSSITHKYGGTGLGLFISKHFCEMMGGSISFSSVKGKGSIFTVTLPANKEMAEDAGVPARIREEAAPPAAGAGTVLVIDDDPVICDLMTRFLSKEGFNVITAKDAEEGLRLARERRPNVITLDVLMPGMDGWTLLDKLNADPDISNIPVLMLTVTDDKGKGLALGAAGFLKKPIEIETLLPLLKRYRHGRFSRCVLLIEDDLITRNMMRSMLEKEGFIVAEAENGRAGLEFLERLFPDLVLLDLMMPEADGFSFIGEFQRHEEWKAIPVVVVTAKDLSSQEKETLREKVKNVFQKGAYSREELMSRIKQLVSAGAR